MPVTLRTARPFSEPAIACGLARRKTWPQAVGRPFHLKNSGGPLRVTTSQPAAIYNGDNSPRQQSWFGHFAVPEMQGTLTIKLLPGKTPGQLRGTFAGTLIDPDGKPPITISNGSFDLHREPNF